MSNQKQKNQSMSQSGGFVKSPKQDTTVRVGKPWVDQNPLAKTAKESLLRQEMTGDKKQLLQNFINNDMKVTQINFNNDPFEQRTYQKSMSLENGWVQKQPTMPGVVSLRKFNYGNVQATVHRKKEPLILIQSMVRGFLQRRRYLVMKNSLKTMLHDYKMNRTVERMVQNDQDQAYKLMEQLERARNNKQQTRVGREVPTQGRLGISKENPFFNCVLEILGDRGLLNQDDFMGTNKFITPPAPQVRPPLGIDTNPKTVKLRPAKLLSKPRILESSIKKDEISIWQAMEKKQSNRKSRSLNIADESIQMNSTSQLDSPVVKQQMIQLRVQQQQYQQQKQNERDCKIQKIMMKEVPIDVQEPKVAQIKQKMKNSTDQIGEDIYEDVSASGVLEENIEEDGAIDDQSIGEYLEEDFEEPGSSLQSAIKESYSIQKESIASAIKESISVVKSIQEDYAEYGDDFEEASQSQSRLSRSKQIKEVSLVPEDNYQQEEFESYKSLQNYIKKKSVTFDESRIIPFDSPKMIMVPLPISHETQPINYVNPKWQDDDNQAYVLARKEAEYALASKRDRYLQLRKLPLDDEAFEALKKEHYDVRRMQDQIGGLINSTGGLWKEYNTMKDSNTMKHEDIKQSGTGSADLLYSKFQFEFHRLLTVNSLGTKFQGILNRVGLSNVNNKTQQGLQGGVPLGALQGILTSLEQQQYVVQQVLQQVLGQLQGLFQEKQAVEEIKQMRMGMDQKLQQLIFKQDKLLNDRMETQLIKRDKDLKSFIQNLFDKQKRELGAVRLLPSQKLQEALQRSFTVVNQLGESQSYQVLPQQQKNIIDKNITDRSIREDSTSFYQPDFEEASDVSRVKTESNYENEQYMHSSKSYDNLASSLSMDHEVNEYESFAEIDWQGDINLFEKKDPNFKSQQETQNLVDQITKMLLEEIQLDLFPQRQQELQQQQEPPKKEQEPIKKKTQETLKAPIVKVVEADDFGMGGPSFSRFDLEKEFDLSGPTQEDEQPRDLKKPEMKQDPDHQKFVISILDKYSVQLLSMKSKVISKFISTMEDATTSLVDLGGLLQKDFHFFRQQEVKEKDALQIIHSLEEQLYGLLLRVVNEKPQQNQLRKSLDNRFSAFLKQAVQNVIKITEQLIPLAYYQDRKTEFEGVYRQSNKQSVPIECLQQYDTQDFILNLKDDVLLDEVHNKILRRLVEETMQDFNEIHQRKL